MSNRDVIGRRTLRARRAATIGIIAASLLSWPLAAAAATSLEAVNLTNFPGALVNQSSRTLYVLSVEKGATLKCKGACLSAWSPLLVKSSVTSITLGANVKGKIGLVKRSATTKQVTFNSYPLYTYDGASTTPERITMHGGTGTTTTTSTTSTTTSTTTTTLSGGAGGY